MFLPTNEVIVLMFVILCDTIIQAAIRSGRRNGNNNCQIERAIRSVLAHFLYVTLVQNFIVPYSLLRFCGGGIL